MASAWCLCFPGRAALKAPEVPLVSPYFPWVKSYDCPFKSSFFPTSDHQNSRCPIQNPSESQYKISNNPTETPSCPWVFHGFPSVSPAFGPTVFEPPSALCETATPSAWTCSRRAALSAKCPRGTCRGLTPPAERWMMGG